MAAFALPFSWGALQMPLVMGAAAEGLPTVDTLVWLLSCVGPHMLDQSRFIREAFPTFRAKVGLLPRVDSLVPAQVGTDAERFPTIGAFKGLLACVDSLVINQIGALCKSLPTLRADVWVLSQASSLGSCAAFALSHFFLRSVQLCLPLYRGENPLLLFWLPLTPQWSFLT